MKRKWDAVRYKEALSKIERTGELLYEGDEEYYASYVFEENKAYNNRLATYLLNLSGERAVKHPDEYNFKWRISMFEECVQPPLVGIFLVKRHIKKLDEIVKPTLEYGKSCSKQLSEEESIFLEGLEKEYKELHSWNRKVIILNCIYLGAGAGVALLSEVPYVMSLVNLVKDIFL